MRDDAGQLVSSLRYHTVMHVVFDKHNDDGETSP